MKRTIIVQPEAQEDLSDIWIYGYRNFGEDQANLYNLKFDKIFSRLVSNELGRRRYEIGNKVFSIPCGQHVIYYKTEINDIFIGRILHHSQDTAAFIFDNQLF
ncbi:type II toxin-antitoxin system RelE/ParE family toxin [Pantoea sp. At-9b]|uniref:type II toxin-antitoxin system RelE/ParE family toxin n=1 Tax=Pantoea sp. (strain At-9b) TaxID=592316 RepID=UPI0001F25E65|nr:type II toxin-antitoxin system RelE/ParE family toxin [Pantoea sp. At-9b]ADU67395.1 plasmid stabilization system [Pantoea sp. At-9b]